MILQRQNNFPATGLFSLALVILGLLSTQSFGQTPVRLISLKPNITQMLVALQVQDAIVGVTKFCRKPNDSAKIIADYTSVAIEEVVRLKPTLVMTSSENAQERQIRQLEALKVPILLTEFKTYADMTASLQKMAAAVGKSEVGVAIEKKLVQTWQDISEIMRTRKLSGKRVVILVQHHPIMIASGGTYISTLLKQAGFVNAFEANRIAYPQLSDEDFLRTDIDIVFDLSYDAQNAATLLSRPLVNLPIDEFLAEPGSVGALKRILEKLK